eukprot:403358877
MFTNYQMNYVGIQIKRDPIDKNVIRLEILRDINKSTISSSVATSPQFYKYASALRQNENNNISTNMTKFQSFEQNESKQYKYQRIKTSKTPQIQSISIDKKLSQLQELQTPNFFYKPQLQSPKLQFLFEEGLQSINLPKQRFTRTFGSMFEDASLTKASRQNRQSSHRPGTTGNVLSFKNQNNATTLKNIKRLNKENNKTGITSQNSGNKIKNHLEMGFNGGYKDLKNISENKILQIVKRSSDLVSIISSQNKNNSSEFLNNCEIDQASQKQQLIIAMPGYNNMIKLRTQYAPNSFRQYHLIAQTKFNQNALHIQKAWRRYKAAKLLAPTKKGLLGISTFKKNKINNLRESLQQVAQSSSKPSLSLKNMVNRQPTNIKQSERTDLIKQKPLRSDTERSQQSIPKQSTKSLSSSKSKNIIHSSTQNQHGLLMMPRPLNKNGIEEAFDLKQKELQAKIERNKNIMKLLLEVGISISKFNKINKRKEKKQKAVKTYEKPRRQSLINKKKPLQDKLKVARPSVAMAQTPHHGVGTLKSFNWSSALPSPSKSGISQTPQTPSFAIKGKKPINMWDESIMGSYVNRDNTNCAQNNLLKSLGFITPKTLMETKKQISYLKDDKVFLNQSIDSAKNIFKKLTRENYVKKCQKLLKDESVIGQLNQQSVKIKRRRGYLNASRIPKNSQNIYHQPTFSAMCKDESSYMTKFTDESMDQFLFDDEDFDFDDSQTTQQKQHQQWKKREISYLRI